MLRVPGPFANMARAVAVKMWKNIGMELKDQSGRFVMPDDPRFGPIYKDIGTHGKTLIAHLAEPDSCWQPPNENSPDYAYYNQHPEWYMFKQPDHPKKATILQARDHVLEENPQLRVVGAHLGSLEMNLDELGRRFDRYSNFAVDVAARTVYLALQPRDKARQFLIKYQDVHVRKLDFGIPPPVQAYCAECDLTCVFRFKLLIVHRIRSGICSGERHSNAAFANRRFPVAC